MTFARGRQGYVEFVERREREKSYDARSRAASGRVADYGGAPMAQIVDRRKFLAAAGAGAAAITLVNSTATPAEPTKPAESAEPQPQAAKPKVEGVEALVFDTFGTVVDWRSSIIAEGEAWGKAKGLKVNWVEFTDKWRMGYGPSMNKVRKGEIPWTRLDDLHRMILDDLLKEYKIEGLTEEEKVEWTHVWRRLKPWPDSPAGLMRLKKKYIITPLSNGNIALMTNLGKFGGLPWDAILGSELVHHYKPDKEVYVSAPFYLDLKPEQVMMCAAHAGDLRAAGSYGLRTGFIYRPNEYGGGPVGKPDVAKPGDFDVVSKSMIDLAQQMGA
jgi:2-haloacid dehalogenase